MKSKILAVITIVFFVVGMIILSIYLNSRDKLEISSEEESGMEIMKVTSANFEEEVLNSDKTVLIDFYADWCGPCKMLAPVLEEIAKENTNTKFVKINVDDAQDLAMEYNVMSIPTLVVIKNGKEVNRVVGLVNKSELMGIINS